MQGRSVAVIGAGPSGLAAAKELSQEGHRVVVFERTAELGGIFRFRPDADTVSVWETCRLTSSILVTSFSDFFPHWQTAAPFDHRTMTHSEYVAYLTEYASHFDVLRCIRFEHEVVDVSSGEGDAWTVSVRDRRGGSLSVDTFDAVAVCTGVHRIPHRPDLPGLDAFHGQVLHAANYKNRSSLRGSSAVFIGGGESGGDIVGELSSSLERSYLSLRRGVFVIPRLLNGLPNDYTGTRLLYSLPDFVSRRTDVEARRLRVSVAVGLLPVSLVRGGLIWGPRLARRLRKARKDRPDARQARVEELIHALRARAGGNQFETFATKTESFLEAVVDGRCELRPGVSEVTPEGVVFEDGSEVAVDCIVLCTGFDPATVPFLSVPIKLERLYRSCFDPEYGDTLAFIGFVRPPIGSIPPMAEMQARWWAQLLSGNVRLPPASEMRAELERDLVHSEAYHNRVFKRLPHLVDFSSYMDALAETIDCKPRLWDLARQPRLLYKVYTAAFSGVQYRLRGPHAAPELATRVLHHARSHARAVRFLDVALAEAARCLPIAALQPHLSLVGRPRRTAGWARATGPAAPASRRRDSGDQG